MTLKLGGLVAAFSLLVCASAAADEGPPLSVPTDKLSAALKCPAGFSHPEREPVLLVHGLTLTPERNFGDNLLKALPRDGFDTCTVALPWLATGDVQEAAEYVVHAVRELHKATGRRVDVIGHSEGPPTTRWAIKWWPDVRENVDDLVSVAGGNHGVPAAKLMCALGGDSCRPYNWQFVTDSRFMRALNAGDESPGDVDYTSIYTLFDGLVQPYPIARIEGGSNILLQSVCPGRYVDHGSIVFDAVMYQLTLHALTRPGPAQVSLATRASCLRAFLPGVNPLDVMAWWPTTIANGIGDGTHAEIDAEPPLRAYATD